ncbi:hypothetical protein [Sphingobacterium griseoflavum]|uniref:Secretory protein n=1 Tax=Sphingobacterium griseoflavum TaxID=1474952 RepID=A0ABQ3HRT1_9SPHI|nr:hypothetical protein [Sphingobacterium griseoflavum]GHE28836.1 hypothetical protein GCM10017764_09260 [Sphingobacterium griseoflavum]
MIVVLLLVGLLITIILSPQLAYANKSTHSGFTIYHNKPVDPKLTAILDEAAILLQNSEFYKGSLNLDICLHDGSKYPGLIKVLLGPAFAWAVYDKVILQGEMNCGENSVELHGYTWNLTQLLAHEMMHCLQYKELGLWKSNPVAQIPAWKWEGYVEFIARQGPLQRDLLKNLDRLENADEDSWGIKFEDGTIAPRELYEYWIMVHYCLAIKEMTYMEVLADAQDELRIKKEIRNWYSRQK